MDSKDISYILNKFGEDLVSKMVAVIIAEDKVVTGKLMNSFEIEVINTINEVSLIIRNTAGYAELVDKGGSLSQYGLPKPSFEAIKSWSRFRGIEQFATPIYRKICSPNYRVKGIHYSDEVTKALKNFKVGKDLLKFITEYLKKQTMTNGST